MAHWWKKITSRDKTVVVEHYTRMSFHAFGGLEAGLMLSLTAYPARLGIPLSGLAAIHASLCTVLLSRALDWRLGRREQPLRLTFALASLTAVCLCLVLVLRGANSIARDSTYTFLLLGFSGFGVAAVTLGLRTKAARVYALLGTVAGVGVISVPAGLPVPTAALNALGVACTTAGMVGSYLFSAWLVSAVWELDASRDLQSRLAVAEERLRFGRDLHDVVGRNLAVIALKSELAVQLAERGRREAVDQMTEVQRIAQETQREVRDVVRGYREADLHIELEGARSVLSAAGIDCTIEGDDGGGLPAQVQSALAWVVREATTNVLRHGDPRRCRIRLEREAGKETEMVLTVENDGAPAAAISTPGNGSGLTGLRERLAVLGGTLDAGRTPGDDFRLTARVPAQSVMPSLTAAPASARTRGSGTASAGATVSAPGSATATGEGGVA